MSDFPTVNMADSPLNSYPATIRVVGNFEFKTKLAMLACLCINFENILHHMTLACL